MKISFILLLIAVSFFIIGFYKGKSELKHDDIVSAFLSLDSGYTINVPTKDPKMAYDFYPSIKVNRIEFITENETKWTVDVLEGKWETDSQKEK